MGQLADRSKDGSGPSRSGRPLVVVLVAGILVGTALSVYFFARSEHLYDPRTIAKVNLLQIGQALAAYEQQYGSLPPAFVAAKDGTPMQSWRVLLLPFFPDEDSQRLARRFRGEEPWNSDFNRELAADRMPLLYYAKPPDPRKVKSDVGRGMTRFVAVTGEGTLWPGMAGASAKGSKRRLVLVEYFGDDIPWTEPRDIPITSLADNTALRQLGLAGDAGPGWALYSDGVVEALAPETNAQTLARLARGEESARRTSFAAP